MPIVRLYGKNPTEDIINDVEFEFAPFPDDDVSNKI
jgi:hypothetical protein